jgi:hypothetical protein
VDSFPDIFEINQAIFGLRFRKARCCVFGKKQEQGTHRQTGLRGPVAVVHAVDEALDAVGLRPAAMPPAGRP